MRAGNPIYRMLVQRDKNVARVYNATNVSDSFKLVCHPKHTHARYVFGI